MMIISSYLVSNVALVAVLFNIIFILSEAEMLSEKDVQDAAEEAAEQAEGKFSPKVISLCLHYIVCMC